jgi:methionyl-tRNA formyltransferase
MRIVFIGNVEFSRRTLEHLYGLGANLVGICTSKQSSFNSDHNDLGEFGRSHDIPCLYVKDINSPESLSWILEKSPDIIFCFGWSRLLGEELLKLAPKGVVGFHPALLPSNRGRHPIIWALVLGLKKTGSTFFLMNSVTDGGDIISQKEVLIDDVDNARSLYDKIVNTALLQLTEMFSQLSSSGFQFSAQIEDLSNYWRKRRESDGIIDWRMSAKAINNLVRGLSAPYVGAYFLHNNEAYRVWKASIFNVVSDNIEPGKVLSNSSQGLIVKCSDGAILLSKLEPNITIKVGSYL